MWSHCEVATRRYGEESSVVGDAVVVDVRRPDKAETMTHARSNHADGHRNQESPRPPCCIAAGFSPEMKHGAVS